MGISHLYIAIARSRCRVSVVECVLSLWMCDLLFKPCLHPSCAYICTKHMLFIFSSFFPRVSHLSHPTKKKKKKKNPHNSNKQTLPFVSIILYAYTIAFWITCFILIKLQLSVLQWWSLFWPKVVCVCVILKYIPLRQQFIKIAFFFFNYFI